MTEGRVPNMYNISYSLSRQKVLGYPHRDRVYSFDIELSISSLKRVKFGDLLVDGRRSSCSRPRKGGV